jgi:Tfp pilus assembly protein PilN
MHEASQRKLYGKTMRLMLVAAMVCLAACSATVTHAQRTPRDVVNEMLAQERDAAVHKDNFSYLSNERSERTNGHLWTERVVETPLGRVRLLQAEDGQALSPARMKQERDRLANDAAHPEAFQKREQAQKDDETHARQMLNLLPRGFILENIKAQGDDWHIDFRPDPKYSPSGTEEKVLHGMSGWLLVTQAGMRLHHIEGRLPADVGIGFGLVANVKAGSNFETTKAVEEGQWRTVRVMSDMRGKAVLFKTISKNEDVARTEFRRVPNNLTVAQAVEMLER